ncbi:MAG: T9SS type A sorting domain-containing protein, partial [Bacteroidota bacterium]
DSDTYPFPVGDGTATSKYKLMEFINNNLNLSGGTDFLNVSVGTISESGLNDDPQLVATEDGTVINELLESAVWTVEPSGTVSSGSWGGRLYIQNISGLSAVDDNMFSILKRPSGSTSYADWDSYDSSTDIPVLDNAGRIYNSGAGYAQKTGFTSFCELAVGKGLFELPVELLEFDAKYNGKTVDIVWSTASEINNDYFEIERSTDGLSFEHLLKIQGAGNSQSYQSYQTEDENPLKGISYYRLKQVDFDGKNTVSAPVAVNIFDYSSAYFYYDTETRDVYIIKNPDDQKIEFNISDMQGRVVYHKSVSSDADHLIINLNNMNLSNGMYIMVMVTGTFVDSKRIFIE